jgi:hypothetical protein
MSGTGPRLVQYAVGWGVGLWLVGYVLGIVFFAIFPTAVIGWMIMPIGLALIIAVLLRVEREPLWFYAILSVVWAALAVILDYVFIVKAFSPADGYYKADVYVYYALTFFLPLLAGLLRTSRMTHRRSQRAGTSALVG